MILTNTDYKIEMWPKTKKIDNKYDTVFEWHSGLYETDCILKN
jgi:hypothetical protein